MEKIAIVIPAKNEAEYIGRLLGSIAEQDYPAIKDVPVYVAVEPATTDRTVDIANSFSGKLRVSVIEGGPVGRARNNGAAVARSEFILFIDGDVVLGSRHLVSDALSMAEKQRLECLTADIRCRDGGFFDDYLYILSNCIQRLSKLHRPFATGMFMMVDRHKLIELGGFNEKVEFAEDYFFSRQIDRRKFGIINSPVYASNRRFKKVGHLKMASFFLDIMTSSLLGSDRAFFKKRDYWK